LAISLSAPDNPIRPVSLNSAKVAVLLISADFLASDFIAENELPPLLTAAEKGGMLILPLILKPSLFDETKSLSKFQSVNQPSEPLIKLPPGEQEDYLVKLSKFILNTIEEAPPTQQSKAQVRSEAIKGLLPFGYEDADFLTLLSAATARDRSPLVMLFDQFEQFFIHSRRENDPMPFVQTLARWYREMESLPVKLLK
jgi:hypothetical protein